MLPEVPFPGLPEALTFRRTSWRNRRYMRNKGHFWISVVITTIGPVDVSIFCSV